jgi:hypothetical protein
MVSNTIVRKDMPVRVRHPVLYHATQEAPDSQGLLAFDAGSGVLLFSNSGHIGTFHQIGCVFMANTELTYIYH